MVAGILVVVGVLAAATAFGLARARRDGRLRAAPPGAAGLTAADLGAVLGSRATLLQFSSSFCAPCRAVRRLLSQVAADQEGVTHVDLDVAGQADLVRRLGIRRTPTLLVLGPDGRIAGRASGVPHRGAVEDVVALAAAGQVTDPGRDFPKIPTG